MISGIVRKAHPFILEADRALPENEKTIFWIIPKTVRGATESAANYAKVQIEKRRKGTKEIDVVAMQNADMIEWLRAIKRIERFIIPENCPGLTDTDSGFDHFLMKAEKEPANYLHDKKAGVIVVKDTADETDLKYIMCAMSPADQEDVMTAYFDQSALREGLKNE